MFADGYTVQNRAGLGLMVVPTVILIPLQYVMFGIGEYFSLTYRWKITELLSSSTKYSDFYEQVLQ